jgi:hypothetical protein
MTLEEDPDESGARKEPARSVPKEWPIGGGSSLPAKGGFRASERSLAVPTDEQFQVVLAKANDAESLHDLRQAFVTLEAVAAKCKLVFSEMVRLATQRLEVERKLGAVLSQTVQRGRPKKRSPEATFSKGPELPGEVSKQNAAKYRKLAAIPDRVFEDYLRCTKSRARLPTSAGARRFAASPKPKTVRKRSTPRSTGTDVPKRVIEAVLRVMDPPDVCVGTAKVGAKRSIGSADEFLPGLAGNVFVSECSEPTILLRALLSNRNKGRIEQAVIWLPAEVGAAWFANLQGREWSVCFLLDADGADYVGRVVAHVGAHAEAFRVVFAELGAVFSGAQPR